MHVRLSVPSYIVGRSANCLCSRQPVYPIIDVSHRYLQLDVPVDLAPIETFSLNMIYSIACHVIPNSAKRQDARNLWQSSGKQARYQSNCLRYRNLAGRFYDKAMVYVEEATLEPVVDTLRAVLLMAINSLFDPKSGNIGQQIALAARLAYSLETKAKQEGTTPEDAEMLRNMHMTIFSIENEIASTLDRPATFPEPVGMNLGSRRIYADACRAGSFVLRRIDRLSICARCSVYNAVSVLATRRRKRMSESFCRA